MTNVYARGLQDGQTSLETYIELVQTQVRIGDRGGEGGRKVGVTMRTRTMRMKQTRTRMRMRRIMIPMKRKTKRAGSKGRVSH